VGEAWFISNGWYQRHEPCRRLTAHAQVDVGQRRRTLVAACGISPTEWRIFRVHAASHAVSLVAVRNWLEELKQRV
jgi:hypothetical protein